MGTLIDDRRIVNDKSQVIALELQMTTKRDDIKLILILKGEGLKVLFSIFEF